MQLVYKPEGADRQVWEFEPGRMLSPEAEAIEEVTGRNFNDAIAGIQGGNMKCTRAFLWVMLKREIPTLKFSELQIRVDEVDFELTDDEVRTGLAALREREANGEKFDAQTQALYETLQAADPGPAPAPPAQSTEDGDDAGKVTDADVMSTAGSSPTS